MTSLVVFKYMIRTQLFAVEFTLGKYTNRTLMDKYICRPCGPVYILWSDRNSEEHGAACCRPVKWLLRNRDGPLGRRILATLIFGTTSA